VHIVFLNPQGNFDPGDSYWTEHPDFGGQLVYVKQVALAIGAAGHQVDILTRRIVDADWPEFAAQFDAYPGAPNVRIVRLPAGPDRFLHKELLWPHLVRDWVPNILDLYRDEGNLPDIFTAHYGDGGLCSVLIKEKTGIPFLFTAHSLGAQKMDKLGVTSENLAQMNARFHFGRRLMAERLSMSHSAINVTSTWMERFEQYGHYAYREAVDVHDGNRFAVIPPGVNLSIFGADARYEREKVVYRCIQEQLARDIAEGRRHLPAIVASSRLDPKKNHLGLVQAFAKSSSLQEQANLVLITGALDDPLHDDAGAGPIERQVLNQIREAAASHDLWGKVSAFGLRGQRALAAAYRLLARRGSVFALTAHYEPFGLAPLEAAAAGLPVVVTRNGGPSESLCEDDEEYGVLVDPADPDDIARGLERLLGDARAWKQFARRGRQRVLARYTWERTAEGYLARIKQIMTSPEAYRPDNPLPISPYLRPPRLEEDVPAAVLKLLYC
jgi:sucrose-phosphate synthase